MDVTSQHQRHLRRYTNLASAIDTLLHKRLTLLDPQRWDDKNDASFLEAYKERTGAKSVLALCFTKSSETYHHWRSYAYGPDGICIEFDDKTLLSSPSLMADQIICRDAIYKEMKALEKALPPEEDLPFVKRYPYVGENEHRMLYISRTKAVPKLHLSIDLKAIRKIKLSPWLHRDLVESVREGLHMVAKSRDIDVYQSKLIDYPRWKNAVAGGA